MRCTDPFLTNVSILYSLKKQENLYYFQGVWNGNIGQKWVNGKLNEIYVRTFKTDSERYSDWIASGKSRCCTGHDK